jgi:pyrimidine-specific ribonucleoside hydrolase
MSTPIVIDCDPGHDDAIALLLALASPEVELLGVTTVHGNQTLEKTTANAIRVLDFAGKTELPVAAGADRPLERELSVAEYVHGETGLDGPALPPPQRKPVPQHAVDFLLERLEPGVVLVPTGPLTNVALALERGAKPDRIVLMGGAIGEGNMTPAAEFNIWADPEAAARVFESGVDVTMVGLDVTHKALFGPDRVEQLKSGGRIAQMVAELFGFYGIFHRETYGWSGSPVHDAVAVAHVIRADLLETVQCGVKVDTECELGRGRTNADRWGRMRWELNAHVAVDIDAEGFLDLLTQRLIDLG